MNTERTDVSIRRARRKVVHTLLDDERKDETYRQMAKRLRVDIDELLDIVAEEGDTHILNRGLTAEQKMIVDPAGLWVNEKYESSKEAFEANAEAEVKWQDKKRADERHEDKLKELAQQFNTPKRRK